MQNVQTLKVNRTTEEHTDHSPKSTRSPHKHFLHHHQLYPCSSFGCSWCSPNYVCVSFGALSRNVNWATVTSSWDKISQLDSSLFHSSMKHTIVSMYLGFARWDGRSGPCTQNAFQASPSRCDCTATGLNFLAHLIFTPLRIFLDLPRHYTDLYLLF